MQYFWEIDSYDNSSLSCHKRDYKWKVLKINKGKLLNHFTKPNKSRPKT